MAKKRITEVPRDGSDADFIPENYMLIDGAEGSAKMRMDLFGKASAVEELDEVKYEKPEGGIPKTDLAEGVQGSLGLADSALHASDIEGKAEKSEMSITNVPDDTTKKTIQLKDGLSHIVVVDHQDISGKAEKSEMSVSAVSGDETKMKIQLKSGTSQNVVIEHQDISGKADKSEMRINAVSGDDTKKTIQLYNGLSQDVVIDVSGKADATDVLTSWQPVASAPATGKLEFHSTRYPTRTEIMLKDATRSGGTDAEDVVVGYTVPKIELGNVGKYLAVDDQLGTSWQSVETTWQYGDSETRQGTLSVGTTLEYDSEEQAYYPHHSSAYIEYNDSQTWLGAFVPPPDIGDAGKFLMVDPTNGVEWKSVDYQPRLTAGKNITIDWQNTISAAVPIDFWYSQNYASEVTQILDGGFYDDSLDIPVPDDIAYGVVKCFIHIDVSVSDLTAPTPLYVRFDNKMKKIEDGSDNGTYSPQPSVHSSIFTNHTVDGEEAHFTECLTAYSSMNANITDRWHCVLHYDAPSGSRVGTVVKIKYCIICAIGHRYDSRTIGDIRNSWT